jgi:hypothetical protein
MAIADANAAATPATWGAAAEFTGGNRREIAAGPGTLT